MTSDKLICTSFKNMYQMTRFFVSWQQARFWYHHFLYLIGCANGDFSLVYFEFIVPESTKNGHFRAIYRLKMAKSTKISEFLCFFHYFSIFSLATYFFSGSQPIFLKVRTLKVHFRQKSWNLNFWPQTPMRNPKY